MNTLRHSAMTSGLAHNIKVNRKRRHAAITRSWSLSYRCSKPASRRSVLLMFC
jgi:hypothetical protein